MAKPMAVAIQIIQFVTVLGPFSRLISSLAFSCPSSHLCRARSLASRTLVQSGQSC